MCFGRKDHYKDEELPRPAPGQAPAQPTYAKMPQQNHSSQHTGSKPSAPPPVELDGAGYAPPPGPPPSKMSGGDYAAPPGPPPSNNFGGEFAAPPGPPPPKFSGSDYTAPPPGPPPSHLDQKPAHDWEALVPDTSLFPPPPDLFSGWDRSPATNATEAEAEAGERWCKDFPMSPPINLDRGALAALEHHDIQLMKPGCYNGTLERVTPGVWSGHTDRKATDSCIISYPPLYAVTKDSPLATGRPKTIYYEVVIKRNSRKEETCLAMGYTALPYPAFRMPGWHRGSLAVHGDDGHKFINDRWGGKNFTQPFKPGETYGLGITLTPVNGKINVDIFHTRNGQAAERWNLHEETDQDQDLPVTGLEGFHDLSCAIGTYNSVDFEVVFDPARWAYKGVPV